MCFFFKNIIFNEILVLYLESESDYKIFMFCNEKLFTFLINFSLRGIIIKILT